MVGALRVIVPRVFAVMLVPVMLTGELRLMLSAVKLIGSAIALVELMVIWEALTLSVPFNWTGNGIEIANAFRVMVPAPLLADIEVPPLIPPAAVKLTLPVLVIVPG